jgi:hypothetical protein
MPGNNEHFQFDGQAGLASLNKATAPMIRTPIHYGSSNEQNQNTVIRSLRPEDRQRSTEGFTLKNTPNIQQVPLRPYQQGNNGMPGGVGNAAWCD